MLGLIPDFQFSANPQMNPYVNPHVSMPSGMYQSGTVQPTYGPVSACGPMPTTAGAQVTVTPPVGYVMIDETPLGAFTDTWLYRNRKLVVLGTIGVGLLAALGLASMLR